MSSKEAAGPTSPAFLFWCHPELVRRRRRREGPYAAFVSSRTQAGLCSAPPPDDPSARHSVFDEIPALHLPNSVIPTAADHRRRWSAKWEPAVKCLRRLTARTFPLKPRSGLTNHLHATLPRAELCA